MRLLNTSTIKLHEFHRDKTPDYAILSHTWGDEEVSLQDLDKEESKSRAGYLKIAGCCPLANKTSSAELSDAINSMNRWYRDAKICYAHLADVSIPSLDYAAMEAFRESRWFTRGWTLQELLAPEEVVFYEQDWKEIGTKQYLQNEVSIVNGIKRGHISDPMNASVAQRMSWASERKTTRLEDVACCLMGFFDVNMPLLYGEGPKAFMRLQYEIARISDDESLLAWNDSGLQWS